MNDSKTISDRLKQKCLDARSRLDDGSCVLPKRGFFGGVRGQFRLAMLTGVATGIFGPWGYEVMVSPAKSIAQGESSNGRQMVMLIAGTILLAVSSALRWFVLDLEQSWNRVVLLKGETEGVVTGLRKDVCGAPGDVAGWMYQPTFTVEYEVSGRTYSTNWEMPYATNDADMLSRSEHKHLGEIIPVRFDLNAPENAIAGPRQNFTVVRLLYLFVSYLGFLLISASIAAFVVSASI